MKLFNVIETSYDRYDETIKKYLSNVFGSLGMQYSHSQIFGAVYDGIRGILQNAMFYIEDALTEQNIFTATRQKSVYSLAKISGYEPYYGCAATGTIIGQIDANVELENKTTKIFIQNYSRIINQRTGVAYLIVLPTEYYIVDLAKPIVKHEFKVVQGRLENDQYIAVGRPWETVNIDTNELWDKEYMSVKVNGVEYTQCASVYDMTPEGEEYVARTGFDGKIEIMFGNGTFGRIVPGGSTIDIQMIKHIGASGNIINDDAASFVIQSSGYDTIGNGVNVNAYMSFRLQNPICGGTNSDSANFIKTIIGYNSRSLVLASEDNFKLFFKRFSFIGYVNCWSEKNSMCITATCLSNRAQQVTSVDEYYSLNPDELLLNDEQKIMIQETLSNSKRTFAGVTLKFQDPIIRRYAIICYVKVNNIYDKDTVTVGIKTTLASYFMKLFNNVHFIPKSDLIKQILDNNSSIKSIDIDIISELAEQTYYNGYYNKYELKLVNGEYKYVPIKVMYEPGTFPGLDDFGNIVLSSKLEIPVLHGGFNYYINKTNDKKSGLNNNNCMKIQTVQVYFI